MVVRRLSRLSWAVALVGVAPISLPGPAWERGGLCCRPASLARELQPDSPGYGRGSCHRLGSRQPLTPDETLAAASAELREHDHDGGEGAA